MAASIIGHWINCKPIYQLWQVDFEINDDWFIPLDGHEECSYSWVDTKTCHGWLTNILESRGM